jgi:hypothetical protein
LGNSSSDTIDISSQSGVTILEVKDPDATVSTVENLDESALSDELIKLSGLTDPKSVFSPHFPTPPFTNDATIVIVNPSVTETLIVDGHTISGDISNFTADESGSMPDGLSGQESIENVVHIEDTPDPDHATAGTEGSYLIGFSMGDFGITNVPYEEDGSSNVGQFVPDGTPTVDLQQFQNDSSGGGGSGAEAGAGAGVEGPEEMSSLRARAKPTPAMSPRRSSATRWRRSRRRPHRASTIR